MIKIARKLNYLNNIRLLTLNSRISFNTTSQNQNQNINSRSINFIFNSRSHYSSDSTKNNTKMESKEQLKQRLTPIQYQVTQEAATERPHSGIYNKFSEKGKYQCIVCHQDLFSSDTKYDSGCGWPAFNDVLDSGKVKLQKDTSIPGGNILLVFKSPEKYLRQEVLCSKCNGHLGHLFDDGPKPTGKRYCINAAALDFVPAEPKAPPKDISKYF